MRNKKSVNVTKKTNLTKGAAKYNWKVEGKSSDRGRDGRETHEGRDDKFRGDRKIGDGKNSSKKSVHRPGGNEKDSFKRYESSTGSGDSYKKTWNKKEDDKKDKYRGSAGKDGVGYNQDSGKSQGEKYSKDSNRGQSRRYGKDSDRSQSGRYGKDLGGSQSVKYSKDSDRGQSTKYGKDSDRSQSTKYGKGPDRDQGTKYSKGSDRSQSTKYGKGSSSRGQGMAHSDDSWKSQKSAGKDAGRGKSINHNADLWKSEHKNHSKGESKGQNINYNQDQNKKKYVDSSEVSSKSQGENKNKYKNENNKKKYGMGSDKNRSTGNREHRKGANDIELCPVYKKCGGCQLQGVPYDEQLKLKDKQLKKLLGKFCKVHPVIGMENPYHYRNKVHAVFDRDNKGNPICGVYQAGTHNVVPVEDCMIEDQKAGEIIQSIRGMLRSFKIRIFDEDTGYGLLRHVVVKRGFTSGEIMVVLVTASPVFPSKKNFVEALRKLHPEITTIIQNVNGRGTSMVLGNKENILYGKGYIEDSLCGCIFRISSKSFYQINPVQTEVLYEKALEAAGLTGSETVIDAYCGIGTIGLIASRKAKRVIGVELNKDAVHDAIKNAKRNEITNTRFFCADAGDFMVDLSSQGETADVVFMDPPRSGSSEVFMDSLVKMKPGKVVYVSCNPETLVRDLEYLMEKGYGVEECWGVDMFGFTSHCEVVCLLSNRNSKSDSHNKFHLDMEEYNKIKGEKK